MTYRTAFLLLASALFSPSLMAYVIDAKEGDHAIVVYSEEERGEALEKKLAKDFPDLRAHAVADLHGGFGRVSVRCEGDCGRKGDLIKKKHPEWVVKEILVKKVFEADRGHPHKDGKSRK